ncbi:MAG: tRNA (adenosine(37)-N6)-threonylcarbamoyltransferase complex ATPase subunit type 1 TsaE [Gammaproteobacteria bacterium]|nr:MAG: tRNA (adenosine(37)-N6)-threonylcarbamoyltransferase complex ATPase subunit type 1 TsaE [Gammaproteobacteria bacterium]
MSAILLKTEKETEQLAKKLAECCPRNARLIVFLNGELGAGKTFFVRALIKNLGYPGLVKSPTYTLVETYKLPRYSINHLDLYRLQSANEIIEMGLCDEFDQPTLWFIEWPEQASAFLPPPDIVCHINLMEMSRQISFQAKTFQGEQTLALFLQKSH